MIYMGYLPPEARSQVFDPKEHLAKVSNVFTINEHTIQVPGDDISLRGIVMEADPKQNALSTGHHVVFYLQGNAGNPLQRIPVFRSLLQAFASRTPPHSRLTIVSFAPRSYWASTNKSPTQKGLLQDYKAALDWTLTKWPEATVTLYGHSLGGSIAVCLLHEIRDKFQPANLPRSNEGVVHSLHPGYNNVRGLVLENPFTSVPDMVRALYPSRWMPYYYLGPLVWDKWDARRALEMVSKGSPVLHQPAPREDLDTETCQPSNILARVRGRMLVLNSELDEIVPPEMGEQLLQVAGPLINHDGTQVDCHGSKSKRVIIRRALHENAWRYDQWSRAFVAYLDDLLPPVKLDTH